MFSRRAFLAKGGAALMAGGFNNPVVGGLDKLIRKAIQSPDYVPGVSGWSINKDGSAEFNNATFRGTVIIDNNTNAVLVYDGTPALGNLEVAISALGGVDSFGNVYNQGIWVGSPAGSGALLTLDEGAGGYSLFREQGGSLTLLHHPNNVNPFANFLQFLFGANSNGLAVGSGPNGKYYVEQAACSAQVIPSGIGTIVTGLSINNLNSDYPQAFNTVTGRWTCPIESYYTITFSVAFLAWVLGSHIFLEALINGAHRIAANDNLVKFGSQSVLTFECGFNAGDTLDFAVAHDTGANQTIDTTAFPGGFGKNTASQITIRRVL